MIGGSTPSEGFHSEPTLPKKDVSQKGEMTEVAKKSLSENSPNISHEGFDAELLTVEEEMPDLEKQMAKLEQMMAQLTGSSVSDDEAIQPHVEHFIDEVLNGEDPENSLDKLESELDEQIKNEKSEAPVYQQTFSDDLLDAGYTEPKMRNSNVRGGQDISELESELDAQLGQNEGVAGFSLDELTRAKNDMQKQVDDLRAKGTGDIDRSLLEEMKQAKDSLKNEVANLKGDNDLQFFKIKTDVSKLKAIQKIHNKVQGLEIEKPVVSALKKPLEDLTQESQETADENKTEEFDEEQFNQVFNELQEEQKFNEMLEELKNELLAPDSNVQPVGMLRDLEIKGLDEEERESNFVLDEVVKKQKEMLEPVEENETNVKSQEYEIESPAEDFDAEQFGEVYHEQASGKSDLRLDESAQKQMEADQLLALSYERDRLLQENEINIAGKQAEFQEELNNIKSEFLALSAERNQLLREKEINDQLESAVAKIALKELHTIEIETKPKKGFFARAGAKIKKLGNMLLGSKESRPSVAAAGPSKPVAETNAYDALEKLRDEEARAAHEKKSLPTPSRPLPRPLPTPRARAATQPAPSQSPKPLPRPKPKGPPVEG